MICPHGQSEKAASSFSRIPFSGKRESLATAREEDIFLCEDEHILLLADKQKDLVLQDDDMIM